MFKIGFSLLQPGFLLFEFGLILYYYGIDVGVVAADLHESLLNIRCSLEEEVIPLSFGSIVDGKDLVELGNLGFGGVQAENSRGNHGGNTKS